LEKERKLNRSPVTRAEAEQVCRKIAAMTCDYIDDDIAKARAKGVAIVEEIALKDIGESQFALFFQDDRITLNKASSSLSLSLIPS